MSDNDFVVTTRCNGVNETGVNDGVRCGLILSVAKYNNQKGFCSKHKHQFTKKTVAAAAVSKLYKLTTSKPTKPVSKHVPKPTVVPKKKIDAVCRYFQMGNCRYGDSCRFSHQQHQQRQTTTPIGVVSLSRWW